MKTNKKYTNKEIIDKLKWFHGEEMEKYPLSEDLIPIYCKIENRQK